MSGEEKDFKRVERFECIHCGRLFKTMRHDCKFDPKKKNCLSCKHCQGQEPAVGHIEEGDYEDAYFKCAAGMDGSCSGIDAIQSVGWNMQCDKWELIDGWKGRVSYCEHLRKIWEKEFDKNKKELEKMTGLSEVF